MADNDDAIYVDVIPRLDEAAADEAAEKLGDKFKNAAKGIGDDLRDAAKNAGDSLKDYFDNDISDALKGFGRNLRDEFKSGDIKSALDDIDRTVRGTTDLVTGLGDTFGVSLDGVGSFGRSISDGISSLRDHIDAATGKIQSFEHGFQALKSGDLAQGVHNLSDAFQGLLPDSFLDNANGVLQTFTNAHDAIKQTAQTFGDLKQAFGLAEAGGAGAFLSGGGELALPVALGAALLAPGGISDRLATSAWNHNFLGARSSLYDPIGIDVPEHALGGPPLSAYGAASVPGLLQTLPQMTPASQLPSFAPLDMPDDPNNPSNQPAHVLPPIAPGGGGTGAARVDAQQAVVEAGSATVMASSLNLSGLSIPAPQVVVPGAGPDPRSKALAPLGLAPPAAPSPAKKSWWSDIPSTPNFPGTDMPGRAGGGMIPGDSPGYDNLLGDLGGSPIGLEGGEFVVNPGATRQNLELLQAINSGFHFDDGGVLPPGAPQPTSPNSYMPTQQAGLGHGSGAGVGGGIIGLAEQAGAMAAGAFSFGGGAIAAQIAEQEINLAVQKGGQMAAVAAKAPFETFGLHGGQMGAPAVGQGGWISKLLGGFIGQQFNAANIAGATQAPKGHDIHQQQDDPGGGNGGKPQGGIGGSGQGTTKDNPLHVSVTNPPSGAPQGAATSWGNMTGVASALTA